MKKIYLLLIIVLTCLFLSKITISQTIKIGTINPVIYCVGNSVNIPFTITGTFTGVNTFTAYLSDPFGSFTTEQSIGTFTDTLSGTISGTIPNTSGTNFRIRIKSSSPVRISDTSAIIIINPLPAISAMTNSICSGNLFSVLPVNGSNGIVPTGTTYSWLAPSVTGGLTGGTSGSGASSITGTLVNPTNTPQTATYTVTPKSGANCTGSTFTVTVTVNPLPQGSLTGSTICNGGIGQLTFTSISGINPFTLIINGSSYSGINSGIPFSVITNPTSTTSYSLTSITDNNGCIRTGITGISATIIVNPLPIISARPQRSGARNTGGPRCRSPCSRFRGWS